MKVLKKKITLIVLALLFAVSFSLAQSHSKVTIEFLDIKQQTELKTEIVQDSIHAERYLSDRLYELYFQGFLGAVVLEKHWNENRLNARIFKGEQYRLDHLTPGNIDPAVLNEVGFKQKNTSEIPFNFGGIEEIFRKILDYAENSGYPFATVRLDSLEIDGHNISASINLWPGPAIVFDSMVIKGFSGVKTDWLADFLNINYGQPYKEKAVKRIGDKLKELRFLSLAAEPMVAFSHNKAKVILDIRQRKINSVDGIIGFLPNASEDSKLLLTGNLNLHLFNLFSSAKQLHLDWQKVKAKSQTLNFKFNYPLILRTPVSMEVGLDLLKEDTLYFNRTFDVAVQFSPGPRQTLSVNTNLLSSRLTGERRPSGSERLYNDFNINYYGLRYEVNHFKNNFSAERGWYFSISGLAGRKTLKNAAIDSTFSGVSGKSSQYKIEINGEKLVPIAKSYIGRFRVLAGSVIGDDLFINDLLRIGGLNTLRGFNENFFFVSDYALGTLEFRIQGGEATYFFAFLDQAIIKNKIENFVDYPLGSGVGLSLSTKSGIFNFIFALGKSESQNFSINSAKIHFGYTGRF